MIFATYMAVLGYGYGNTYKELCELFTKSYVLHIIAPLFLPYLIQNRFPAIVPCEVVGNYIKDFSGGPIDIPQLHICAFYGFLHFCPQRHLDFVYPLKQQPSFIKRPSLRRSPLWQELFIPTEMFTQKAGCWKQPPGHHEAKSSSKNK